MLIEKFEEQYRLPMPNVFVQHIVAVVRVRPLLRVEIFKECGLWRRSSSSAKVLPAVVL